MEDEYEKTISIYDYKKKKKDIYIIINEKNEEKTINLSDFNKEKITFGRKSNNDIVISSKLVSGNHGAFIISDDIKVIDNDSTNGIFINGTLEKESILEDGDVIKIDNPDTSLDDRIIITVYIGKIPESEPKKEIIEEKIETKPVEEVKEETKTEEPKKDENDNNKGNSNIIFKFIVATIIIIIGIVIINKVFLDSNSGSSGGGSSNSKAKIKVDISMTNYNGTIEEILDELGLDFDLVTSGSNCYTGVYKTQFETEKYGILYTEFRYCKANETTIFRVYNDEKDQKLREPKSGELPSFDSYGHKRDADL